ncbi:phospholipid scramblase-like [Penaeus indicus]|uniref:phospholipid scramblase-like n=1 Tax=Penaeus indicus TaxID=29960 RepID=UPI00300CC3A1
MLGNTSFPNVTLVLEKLISSSSANPRARVSTLGDVRKRLQESSLRKNPEPESLRQFVVAWDLSLATPATPLVPNCLPSNPQPLNPNLLIPTNTLIPNLLPLVIPNLLIPNSLIPNLLIPNLLIPNLLIPNLLIPNPLIPNLLIPNPLIPNLLIPNPPIPNPFPLIPNPLQSHLSDPHGNYMRSAPSA